MGCPEAARGQWRELAGIAHSPPGPRLTGPVASPPLPLASANACSGRRNLPYLNSVGPSLVAADIVASSGTARAWGLDVADSAATIRVVAEVAAAFGGLDIVINNAGVAQFLALDDPAYDEH